MTARSSPPEGDLYRELEVDPSASSETIEAAWRSLVKRHHPDSNPGQGNDRIRRLNAAHDWLIDPTLRARYDALRRRGMPREGAGSHARPAHSIATTTTGEQGSIRVSPSAWLWYLAGCLLSVVAAYVVSVIAGVILSSANITSIAAGLIGEEGAASLLQLLGNLLFAVVLGYLVVASFASAFHQSGEDGTLVVVGAVTALAITFGFPAFARSYLTGLVDWMLTDGAGLPAIATISLIEGITVGLVVAGTGWMRRPG